MFSMCIAVSNVELHVIMCLIEGQFSRELARERNYGFMKKLLKQDNYH
jgi:hypothetical protein